MANFVSRLNQKPHWIDNLGFWRIVLVFQWLAFVPCALTAAAAMAMSAPKGRLGEAFWMGLGILALGFVALVIVRSIARCLCWITAGFNSID